MSVEQQYRDLLPRVFALYPSLASKRVKETHREVTHVAHGWYMRCHRGVEAVLQLERTGFQEEAGPIRRSIVEHVVALKWLAVEGNSVSTVLRRGASHEAGKRKDALQTANWTSVDLTDFDAVVDDGKDLDKRQDNLLQFRRRCDEYGTPHDWASYLTEVARFHPSWESAVPYFRVDEGSVILTGGPTERIGQAGFCLIHLYEALVAFHEIVVDAPLAQELEQLEREILTLVVQQRRDLGLSIPPELETRASELDRDISEERTG
ncbi:DUF5677 domain-containing protein [Streptacidiphilus neutrinimicus]|uniref:DUF5677 domain-containing protein n=1 Tax=Streptacidiphilus neutrinimicus TaxID=105420 RepID=UPI0005A68351|nr:DUF5677 domain-containing protein [Streptacidiphilus neutrinimicus]